MRERETGVQGKMVFRWPVSRVIVPSCRGISPNFLELVLGGASREQEKEPQKTLEDVALKPLPGPFLFLPWPNSLAFCEAPLKVTNF